MRSALILLVLVSAGCAAKPRPVAIPRVDLAPADALFDAGCYRCLEEAFAAYDGALRSPMPPDGTRAKAFATAILLAVREKEIGLDATPWIDRASALASPEEARYVDAARQLPWASAGASVDFEPPVRVTPLVFKEWLALPPGPQPLLDQYVFVALACANGERLATIEGMGRLGALRPGIRYRLGICGPAGRAHLDAVVAADPRFVEASFYIGRYEMTAGVMAPGARPGAATREWLTRSVPPLVTAHEGLPESPIVTIVLAGLMRSRTELARALALYDEALTIRPTQRDALLGRLITLSYLRRPADAIATATKMIDLGTWYVGSAYYWRAWNQYQTAHLEDAAADIAAARRLLVDDDVLTLSGMVAYDQKRPVDARADFNGALQMNPNRCLARWYLGLLNVDEEAWRDGVTAFATAGGCFDAAAESTRSEIAQLPADLPAEARQQQIASLDESIATSLQQAGRAYFNAAQASMRLNDRTAAATYARSASAYEGMRERAEALLKAIERN